MRADGEPGERRCGFALKRELAHVSGGGGDRPRRRGSAAYAGDSGAAVSAAAAADDEARRVLRRRAESLLSAVGVRRRSETGSVQSGPDECLGGCADAQRRKRGCDRKAEKRPQDLAKF